MDKITDSIALPSQKNIVRFFKSFDLPHIVCIKVNQSKFLVNSLLLVLHSSVFEDMIYSGAEEITLHESLQFSGAEDMLYQSLLFLHGETVNICLGQISNLYHFASVYKIKSIQERCEKSFVNLLQDVETYVRFVTEWFLNRTSCWSKDLIINNSKSIIELLTSSENLTTIMKTLRSESHIQNSSLVSAMFPCTDMINLFYIEVLKKLTEPSNAIGLENSTDYKTILTHSIFPKKPNVLSSVVEEAALQIQNTENLTNKELVAETSNENTDLKSNSTFSCSEREGNLLNVSFDSSLAIHVPAKEIDSESIVNTKTGSSSNTSCDKFLSALSPERDLMLSFDVTGKAFLSLTFANFIELSKTIQRRYDHSYFKIDVFLSWILLKQYHINDKEYSTFCSSFNSRILAREYMIDVKQALSNIQKSSRIINCSDYEGGTFFVLSKIMPRSYVQTQIKGGVIKLRDADCQLGSCKAKTHKLQISVQLKKVRDDSAKVLPNSCNHNKIIHFYLLGLSQDLFVENIISLKVLTKAEIIKACNLYPNFVLKVIYRQD